MIFNENNSKLFFSQPIQIIFHSSHFWSWRFLFFLLILEIRPIELSYGCFRTSIFSLASTLYFSYSFFLYFILPSLLFIMIFKRWLFKQHQTSPKKNQLIAEIPNNFNGVCDPSAIIGQRWASKKYKACGILAGPTGLMKFRVVVDYPSIRNQLHWTLPALWSKARNGNLKFKPPFYPLIVLFIVSYTYQCLIKMISLDE